MKETIQTILNEGNYFHYEFNIDLFIIEKTSMHSYATHMVTSELISLTQSLTNHNIDYSVDVSHNIILKNID